MSSTTISIYIPIWKEIWYIFYLYADQIHHKISIRTRLFRVRVLYPKHHQTIQYLYPYISCVCCVIWKSLKKFQKNLDNNLKENLTQIPFLIRSDPSENIQKRQIIVNHSTIAQTALINPLSLSIHQMSVLYHFKEYGKRLEIPRYLSESKFGADSISGQIRASTKSPEVSEHC